MGLFRFSKFALRGKGAHVLRAFNNIQVKDLRQFQVVVGINESSRQVSFQEDG